MLVLGADGDLTRRLLLPGLASLLGSDWCEGRTVQLLGAGLSELSERQWHQHVDSIEIVYDESLGLEGRAGYYDRAGALVDMLQSHLLQVMALLLMDPVTRIDERELRDAKGQVLRATRIRGAPREASRRARYTAGAVGDRRLPA